MLKGFKDFIARGNIVDLATAVIIGVAFGAIVDSLVKDVITPVIGMLGGQPDFSAIRIGAVNIGNFITIEGTVTHGAEPEFTWGYRAAVAVVIPLFTRHSAAVRVEEAAAAQALAQREAAAQRIRGAVMSAALRAACVSERAPESNPKV